MNNLVEEIARGGDLGDVACVLVSGEHHSVSLGSHASITQIGQAYSYLRQKLARSQIIVIAQVEECRKWHHEWPAAKKINKYPPGHKYFIPPESKRYSDNEKTWEQKKDEFDACTSTLISEGGADYDGLDVNPETVLRVLRGDRSEKYHKVVPYHFNSQQQQQQTHRPTRVFLCMFSHGNWKEETETHYFWMPHPSPTVCDILAHTERVCTNYPPYISPSAAAAAAAAAAADGGADGSLNAAVPPLLLSPRAASSPPRDEHDERDEALSPSARLDAEMQIAAAGGGGGGGGDSDAAAVAAATIAKISLNEAQAQEVSAPPPPPPPPLPIQHNFTPHITYHSAIGDELFSSIYEYLPLAPLPAGTDLATHKQHMNMHLHWNKPPNAGEEEKDPEWETREALDNNDSCLLHWQYVFDALKHVLSTPPPAPPASSPTCVSTLSSTAQFFIFQQSCGSGGMFLFLANENYRLLHHVDKWPLFAIYTAKSGTSAIGSAWEAFFFVFKNALALEAAPGTPNPIMLAQERRAASAQAGVGVGGGGGGEVQSSSQKGEERPSYPLIIGLTGGICSGKSSIADFFAEYGKANGCSVAVIDADKIGHEAYRKDTACFASLVEAFGDGIVNKQDGEVDRKALGAIVFSESSKMQLLNNIVWPAIRALLVAKLQELKEQGTTQLVVLEAAIMIEAGWDDLVDQLWVSHVDPALAKQRLMARNGLSAEAADQRLASQMSNEERCRRAQVLVENNVLSQEELQALLVTKWQAHVASSIQAPAASTSPRFPPPPPAEQYTLTAVYDQTQSVYYKEDQAVVDINFRMNSTQRNDLGMHKYGVLGCASGSAEVENMLLSDFFA